MDADTNLEIRSLIYGTNTPGELPPGVVHVWQRSLSSLPSEVHACHELLSPDERERASRYRVERARSEFILTRAALRSLLAAYLKRTPQDLVFQATQYGKPFLHGSDLSFNVSHTDGLALLGFVRRRQIGVDVEKIRPEPEARKLAERFFSSAERRALQDFTGGELQAAFFRCWTRKEAYIKARGEGLSLPLDQFDVQVEAKAGWIDLATRPDPHEAGRWLLCDAQIIPGYTGALALSKDRDSH